MRRRIRGLVLASLLVPSMATSATESSGSIVFGLHLHRAVPGPAAKSTTVWPSVQFDSWRLWDAGVAWPSIEPAEGQWDFARLDAEVALAEKAKVDVLMTMALCPKWAARRADEPSSYQLGNASPPRDISDWAAYASTVASRYRRRIRAYEILNEPDLPGFFTGNVADAVAMVREAALAIRSADSTALIVGPAISGPHGVKWLEDFLDAGGGKYLDVVSIHGYMGQRQPPESALDLYEGVRESLQRHGLGALPIWNTEVGWQITNRIGIPAGGDTAPAPAEGALSAQTAGEFVARTYLAAFGAGVGRVYWYAWDNYRMGLVEPDGRTPKSAAAAYGVVYSWLLGASSAMLRPSGPNGYELEVNYRSGERALFLWNLAGERRVVPTAEWASALISDLNGGRRSLTAEERTTGIRVGSSPVMLRVAGAAGPTHRG
jgi:hypothetical protein